ncbi:MAG: 4'-phosphopantetheinyl transferase superfamily protein [Verrucomicrobiota bacterium]
MNTLSQTGIERCSLVPFKQNSETGLAAETSPPAIQQIGRPALRNNYGATRTCGVANWDDSPVSRNKVATLGETEIQVWLAPVPHSEAHYSRFAKVLSRDEIRRTEQFKHREARCEFVFGRFMLRTILGAYLNLAPAKVEFDYQPRGKPGLATVHAENNLHFNQSHAGGLTAIALTRGRDVGIDIESIATVENWDELTELVFSPGERQELYSMPKTEQRKEFLKRWTSKEALLKCIGVGLIDELGAVEIPRTTGQRRFSLNLPGITEEQNLWDLYDLPLPDGYAGAVVTETSTETDTESGKRERHTSSACPLEPFPRATVASNGFPAFR